LQVFPSSRNVNPTSQEQSCFSFLLLHIWLQPPLFAWSQGCTKNNYFVNHSLHNDRIAVRTALFIGIVPTTNLEISILLPMIQDFPSSSNTYPSSQAHSYLWSRLLQIWLQPPFVAVSQGCTKNGKVFYKTINSLWCDWHMQYYVCTRHAHLFCRYCYLFPARILLRMNMYTIPSSCYRFDCTRLYLLYHNDVLTLEKC